MTTIQVRRGTSAQWSAKNTILAAGEPGLDTSTGLLKIGDGVTPWNTLLAEWAPATLVSNAPRGVVAIGTAIDGITLTVGNTYLTGNLNYTFSAARRYRVVFVIRALTAGVIHFQLIDVPSGTTQVNDQWFSSDRSYNGSTFTWLMPRLSATYTYGVRVSTNFTASIVVYCRDFYIEDVGAWW